MREATIDLKHGDCLELMKDIPDGSVFNRIKTQQFKNV